MTFLLKYCIFFFISLSRFPKKSSSKNIFGKNASFEVFVSGNETSGTEVSRSGNSEKWACYNLDIVESCPLVPKSPESVQKRRRSCVTSKKPFHFYIIDYRIWRLRFLIRRQIRPAFFFCKRGSTSLFVNSRYLCTIATPFSTKTLNSIPPQTNKIESGSVHYLLTVPHFGYLQGAFQRHVFAWFTCVISHLISPMFFFLTFWLVSSFIEREKKNVSSNLDKKHTLQSMTVRWPKKSWYMCL